MMYLLLKVVISAVIVVAVAELGKRFPLFASLTASLPILSLLAMVWLYYDTRSNEQVAKLSTGVFWLVLPSLVLFIMLPWLLKRGLQFPLALGVASLATIVAYLLMLGVLRRFGIEA